MSVSTPTQAKTQDAVDDSTRGQRKVRLGTVISD
ncbi:MAG: hypothetical protein QOG08_1185, partial [Chloroflexota bacterium]|nr:hypothetical protein [Chloroflexota bacterium]